MTKVDHVSDLPEWFDLEHYQGAESFGAVEWYWQIAQRHFLFALLDYLPDEGVFFDKARKAFSRSIPHVRGVSVERAQIPGFFGESGIHQVLLDSGHSVRSLELSHLRGHASLPGGESLHNLELADTSTGDGPLFLSDVLSYPDARYAALRVDLGAPDSVILESFKVWLSEVRTIKGRYRDKEFYRPKYRQWARYGILPYLDLIIWEKETGVRIPDRVMAAAISRYDAGESNLRKTVKPLALALMQGNQAIDDLMALAALEATANKET